MPIPTAPHQAHSPTSQDAAEAIDQSAATLRQRVLKALHMAGTQGLTDQEIQDQLGMDPSTERPRRIELVKAQLVMDSGRTRATKSGRAAVVWVVC